MDFSVGDFIHSKLASGYLVGIDDTHLTIAWPKINSKKTVSLDTKNEFSRISDPIFIQFLNREIYVNCPSHGLVTDFLTKCQELNIYWVDGERGLYHRDYVWREYKEETCILINDSRRQMQVGATKYYKDKKIIVWE